ncbi:GNAT family N-acetyltransferase [Nesterenkonia sandarakina]|uniref:Ribosomal protein S18 acetylase RimI-like enzyme n=1 Tax=Nesterenkonia sandarakina TaxID=272918 RepID=A0A2T0YF09_9MICC|nr:GNAT family N-acetyltransferase [Nesterenkonia sandarakina]PRZ13421.1 ribosomal protein S18 acetylase RimI-like enzyme [Nesterenkonia sandarakina]
MITTHVVSAKDLVFDEVLALYGAVQWTAYTDDPASLRKALEGSSTLVAAHDDQRLVGLARVISDGSTICYLQDILVLPSHRRAGVGRALAERALAEYPHVRQKVLITDDGPQQRAFYEALGYTRSDEFPGGPIRAFVRFD